MHKEKLCRYFPEFQTYLYRLAYARLHNRMDAEDAVQEAYIRAWFYCEHLAKEDAFPQWLTRILVNECNNILRKKKRNPEVYVGDDVLQLFITTDEAHATQIELLIALGALEDRYRIPIQMIFFYGFTSEETAARLHMTRSAVSGMVRRGKEKLRAVM